MTELLLLLLHCTFLIAGENGCMQNIANKCNFMLKINLLASSECNWMYHNFFCISNMLNMMDYTFLYTFNAVQKSKEHHIRYFPFMSPANHYLQWSMITNIESPNVFFTTTPTQKCKVEQTIIYSVKNSHVLYLGNHSYDILVKLKDQSQVDK